MVRLSRPYFLRRIRILRRQFARVGPLCLRKSAINARNRGDGNRTPPVDEVFPHLGIAIPYFPMAPYLGGRNIRCVSE